MAELLKRRDEGTRAYRAIKSRLSACELPPGKYISINIIAESLGVGVTPVRTACRRLAEEGWAIRDKSTGYFAWCPDENVLAGLYDHNREILTSALDDGDIGHPVEDGDTVVIWKLRKILTHHELTNASLASYTGVLFFAIVALTGNKKIMLQICGANERLYYLRKLECEYFENTACDLRRICDLALAVRQKQLRRAIVIYHDWRRDLARELYRILAAQEFH